MNKEIKKQIKEAFEPPEPERKIRFLKTMNFPKTDRKDFIIGQIFYIQKSVWIVSVFVFCFILFNIFTVIPNVHQEEMTLWVISSIVPFLALFSVVEIFRSKRHKMAEMEVVCRFGLAQLMFARMLILGVWNGIILLVTIVTLGIYLPEGIGITALYLLTPFVIVCGMSLFVMNHTNSHNSELICAAITVGVNMVHFIWREAYRSMDWKLSISIMIILFASGLCFMAVQLFKTMKKMEENQWNFA